MGFGDHDHPHPLNLYIGERKEGNCFRCELPIIRNDTCYGCASCNHLVHQLCFELPQNMRHPLHPQHFLTLSPSPSSQITTVCNQCHDPILGGYMYHCESCLEFNLHLKCFLTLDLKQKHEHPLILYDVDIYDLDVLACVICGVLIDDIDSFTFACRDCKVYIHYDCIFLPPTVEHHHRHELNFEYNYPEESDLAYCDVCEDNVDDKELDRNLSYYYCKICDYIAHVHCVTIKPTKVITHLEHHEHPMIYSRKPRRPCICCACNFYSEFGSYYFCDQCDTKLHKSCADFPRFIKHPHHKEHSLSLRSHTVLDSDGELSFCNSCHRKFEGYGLVLQCIDCEYVEHVGCAVCFKHPHYPIELRFSAYYNTFRCNACGDLGVGYRMSHSDKFLPLQYDLHLECFSLPGKIEQDCHSHPLYLTSSPTKLNSYLSTTFSCDICHAEVDLDFWIYCCKKCNYIAHLKCVAGDLLSSFRLSNNLVGLSSITECVKSQYIDEDTLQIGICSWVRRDDNIWRYDYPVFSSEGFFKDPKSPIGDHNRQPIISDVTDLEKPFIDVLHCPECEQPISVQAYSCIYDWVHRNVKANIYPVQIETPTDYKSLALLDEKVVDKLYCPICDQLVFPPTYSCVECQIFFHKSCAELPRKYIDDDEHTFVLKSSSMRDGSLTHCLYCSHPIKGYAYFCTSCETVLDVTCAMGAPLLKLENQKHNLFGKIAYLWGDKCKACNRKLTEGTFSFQCGAPNCYFYLHVECALLPCVVKHRIHMHPLVLEPHLDLSVDDYICDVCEDILNPCIWVYRCSDSCGDRATSHVSCIVTSNKKCRFIYDEECSYPHLDQLGRVDSPEKRMEIPVLASSLVNATPEEQESLLRDNLFLFVDELEHEYAPLITRNLVNMYGAEVLQFMESPDALKAKVAEAMKSLILLGCR